MDSRCLRSMWTGGVVDSPELGEVVASGMSTKTSRFSPLNPRLSPVSMIGVPQIVVESPTSYEVPVDSKDVCLTADRVVPNQVWADNDFDTMDVFPMYAVSPRNDGYFPHVSPISTPNALSKPVTPATGSLMNEVTGSFDSAVGSPVTSLSIADYTADLNLLLEPLIPLLEVLLLQTARPRCGPHMHRPSRLTHRQRSCHAKGHLTLLPNPLTDFILIDRVPLPDDDVPGGGCGSDGYGVRDAAALPEISVVHRCAGVGPVLGSSPGRVALGDGPPRRPHSCDAVAAGCRTHGFESDCPRPICDVAASNVNGGDAVGVRSGILPLTIDRRRCAGATSPPRFHSDGGHGFMASTGKPGRSQAGYRSP